jgi:trehalose 6-phosphate synthase
MKFFRLRLVASLLLGITLISVASTYFDVLAHRHTLRGELARRTQWFGASLQTQIEQQFLSAPKEEWPAILERLRQHPDQPSLAVFNNNGQLLASAGNLLPMKDMHPVLLNKVLTAGKESSTFVKVQEDTQRGTAGSGNRGNHQTSAGSSSRLWYEDVIPLHSGGQIVGALLMLVDADYIRTDGNEVWQRSFLRIAALVVLVVVVTLAMVRWFLLQPLTRAAEWLRRLRHGEAGVEDGANVFGYLLPLAKEVNFLTENLTRAREAAVTEARLRDAAEHVWTADRLAVHVRQRLGNGKIFVVSNREPYMHVRRGGTTECIVPPSGLVTAIEPILQACDGTWIAHGSGNDDAANVDERDRLRVPPDDKRYTLRRVWLSPEEEAGYYEGFSNEGLWPLCHIAHTRPNFRASDWAYYQNVNKKFSEVLIEEMRGTDHPVVFVQDYHFALLPKIIKRARPDARVAIFWHIPWPNAEVFSICPWQAELVDGLVSADVIGFHLQSHCNNFLDTVDRVLEARTDREQFSIRRKGHHSAVRPYPISVAWDENDSDSANFLRTGKTMEANGKTDGVNHSLGDEERSSVFWNPPSAGTSELRRDLGMEGKQLLLGVDRTDYTKGIVERLLAYELLLEEHPRYQQQIVFVQIASPSRTSIPAYEQLRVQVEETVERINQRFQTSRWKPVILIERQCNHLEIVRYYQAADLCLVTSLHDGMNLVAKEFIAARKDCDGVLVLSSFTGAAQELTDALIVNPYDSVQVSEAIRTGLEMSPNERRLRMERMRRQVREHNVYRWASNILTDLCAVRIEDEIMAVVMNRTQRKRA